MPDATATPAAQPAEIVAPVTTVASVHDAAESTPIATVAEAPATPVTLPDADTVSDEELEELLIKEITIDGMCGVY